MAAGISRRIQAGIALCLGVLAGLAALIVWIHRVDFVLTPWLWSQIRGLQERRSSFPHDPAFVPAGKHGLSRFDVLLSRLIRLRQPGFCGGTNFELMPLRSEEGSLVYLAEYEPLEVPFDQEPEVSEDEDEVPTIVLIGDGCFTLTFLALDASGRPLGKAWALRVPGHGTLLVEEPEGFTTFRVPAKRWCFSCSSRGASDRKVFSVDRKGIVPRGRVPGQGLAAPLCRDPRYGSSGLDPAALAGILASALPADLHRALMQVELAGPNESGRAAPLLEHPDPWLRARAAAIVGGNPAFRPKLGRLLEDPDPRVRFAAVEGAGRDGGERCWEDALLPLTEGNDQAVAMRAHRDLVHSADPAIAARSILELLRDRDPYVTDTDFCLVADPEAAKLAVDWLEAEPETLSNLEVNLWNVFPPEVLRPFAERLVRTFEGRRDDVGRLNDLARVLVKVEHPLADEALLKFLSDPSGDEGSAAEILRGFLTRGPQPISPALRPALEEVLRTGGGCRECDDSDCRTAAALLLAREGSLEGAVWLARNYWDWPRPYSGLAAWIGRTWEDWRLDCSERASISLPFSRLSGE